MCKGNMSITKIDFNIPVNVFQYWGQGLSAMPPMLKHIHAHNAKVCARHNINLVLIDDLNVSDYITVHPKFKHVAYNFKSDIVRWSVLDRYGGFWFDTDVILIKDLDLICQNMGECECMFDVEIPSRGCRGPKKIGCASIYMKKQSVCSNFCVRYVNQILAKERLAWDDIGPATAEMLYKEHQHRVKLNSYNSVKNGCNFITWAERPGYNKKNWYFNDAKKAMSRFQDIKNNPACFYVITWTIYRMHNMGADLMKRVFDDPRSVFHWFLKDVAQDV